MDILIKLRRLFFKSSNVITDAFLQKHREVMHVLDGFSSDRHSLIDYNTLRSLVKNKWYYLDENQGRYKLTKLTDLEAVFITEMREGGTFGLHEHDCVERGVVVEGHLIDNLNNLKVLKGEKWEYKKNQDHKPYCRVRSIYEVSFSEI